MHSLKTIFCASKLHTHTFQRIISLSTWQPEKQMNHHDSASTCPLSTPVKQTQMKHCASRLVQIVKLLSVFDTGKTVNFQGRILGGGGGVPPHPPISKPDCPTCVWYSCLETIYLQSSNIACRNWKIFACPQAETHANDNASEPSSPWNFSLHFNKFPLYLNNLCNSLRVAHSWANNSWTHWHSTWGRVIFTRQTLKWVDIQSFQIRHNTQVLSVHTQCWVICTLNWTNIWTEHVRSKHVSHALAPWITSNAFLWVSKKFHSTNSNTIVEVVGERLWQYKSIQHLMHCRKTREIGRSALRICTHANSLEHPGLCNVNVLRHWRSSCLWLQGRSQL